MNRVLCILVIILAIGTLSAQNTLQINGLNEASFTYRTAEDSLNAYFRDAFAWSMNYRDFSFGMKFVAELPKYSTNQSELLGDLVSNKLDMDWKELFVSYSKDSFKVHAGTIMETFGVGMNFRSWEDLEFDKDNRIDGFLTSYDNKLKLKALYGAIANIDNPAIYDLAYGADAQYPLFDALSLGATALTYRTYTPFNTYNQQDVFGGRGLISYGNFDAAVEYSQTELYKNNGISRDGTAIYANANLYLHPFQFGAAYKNYQDFFFRLQDLPAVNYHNETLADNQASGIDEEGAQGWITWNMNENWSLTGNYAEAWDSEFGKRMNDIYTALEWEDGYKLLGLEYSHVEKVDTDLDQWQAEMTPGLHGGTMLWGKMITTKAEYKYVEKRKHEITSSHYEPKLQADFSIGDVALSLGVQSHWTEVSELMDALYWTNVEAKYSLFEHTDLLVFAGKDAGGKVCRNGTCRYVAPFKGVKVELSTRF
ncbi:MAG: hypothetical protein CVU48_03825 [Candidatus Cloacimonetes bacterium HGW-Cloacimonetes-1]|jgi:hypothetical protein|nr:MAG: hypothetical protein CVU48_03825 [Candidatus Cloacimonetes bacterium HGW-Cloacimonetes-1]